MRVLRWFQLVLIASVACISCKSEPEVSQTRSESSLEQHSTKIPEVDFDKSMGKGSKETESALSNPSDKARYDAFKKIFEDNLPSKVKASDAPKIPKILHQIWLGYKTPPDYFYVFRDKWQAMHPDWEYKLWTDADLDGLSLELRDLIEASPNFAEKSDILRAELLERFGGLYVDVDMDPQHVMSELNYKYDFFAGLEFPHKIATTDNKIWVGISIIGSAPHHPIMKRWKEYIRARWEPVNQKYSSPVERVINHTYFPFSFAVLEKFQDGDKTNIFFPATYFYPLTCADAAKQKSTIRSIREKFYTFLERNNLKSPRPFSRVMPESLAVHYWGNSWLPTRADLLKDMQKQMDLVRRDMYAMQKKMRALENEAEKRNSTSLAKK